MTTTPSSTGAASLRIVEDIALARESVLKREPVAEPVLPEAVQQSINDLWGEAVTPAEHVRRILEAVRTEGDAAVRRFSQQFDGSSYTSIEVGPEEIAAAYEQVTPEQHDAIAFAVQRVRRYHEMQMEHAPTSFVSRGTGMVVRPLKRAGCCH